MRKKTWEVSETTRFLEKKCRYVYLHTLSISFVSGRSLEKKGKKALRFKEIETKFYLLRSLSGSAARQLLPPPTGARSSRCRPSKGRKRGFCWCVDKYGQPLPGFDARGKGDVHCYSMDSKDGAALSVQTQSSQLR
ncbi:insulin-like growth factor binding [Lynx pardinus]|uniref:Insulin-like growth factor binding n=1 Tax=Lynx pardinus TaxID=191816 RepID=A0A485MUI4_LYNPA|nr:insulin-like growth factor binding [Lynx pardinus]